MVLESEPSLEGAYTAITILFKHDINVQREMVLALFYRQLQQYDNRES